MLEPETHAGHAKSNHTHAPPRWNLAIQLSLRIRGGSGHRYF